MPTYNRDAYDISRAFGRIERELLSSMMRNMERHKAEETEYGFDWPQWQALQLQELRRYRKENREKFKDDFDDINHRVEEALRMAHRSGQSDQEAEILKLIRDGRLEANRTFDADFFRLNNRRLDALVEATTNDIQKAEQAILRMADDKYRQTVFDAQVYFASGAGTYEKAVDMATHDLLMAGLNCIEYKNGARHTAQDYVEMVIRTSGQRAYLRGEGQKRNEWGIHTVIANKRGNPCPKCAPWCGKVMVDDVYAGGTAAEARKQGYPRVSTAMQAGFLHPRCKDSYTTYFPGISQEPEPWTKEELDMLDENARREAEQKHAEKMAEKCGRVAAFSLDPEKKKEYAGRAAAWKRKAEIEPETVAKGGESGIINTKRIINKKITQNGKVVNPMSEADYHRMSEALIRQGVEVFSAIEGDDLRYMLHIGAEGTYSDGRITHIGEIPSRGTFFEEIIHMAQSRKYGELDTTDVVELCAREVEANRKLLKNKNAYKLDNLDVEDIGRNLKEWEQRFLDATGVKYDESNYRRKI